MTGIDILAIESYKILNIIPRIVIKITGCWLNNKRREQSAEIFMV